MIRYKLSCCPMCPTTIAHSVQRVQSIVQCKHTMRGRGPLQDDTTGGPDGSEATRKHTHHHCAETRGLRPPMRGALAIARTAPTATPSSIATPSTATPARDGRALRALPRGLRPLPSRASPAPLAGFARPAGALRPAGGGRWGACCNDRPPTDLRPTSLPPSAFNLCATPLLPPSPAPALPSPRGNFFGSSSAHCRLIIGSRLSR